MTLEDLHEMSEDIYSYEETLKGLKIKLFECISSGDKESSIHVYNLIGESEDVYIQIVNFYEEYIQKN